MTQGGERTPGPNMEYSDLAVGAMQRSFDRNTNAADCNTQMNKVFANQTIPISIKVEHICFCLIGDFFVFAYLLYTPKKEKDHFI